MSKLKTQNYPSSVAVLLRRTGNLDVKSNIKYRAYNFSLMVIEFVGKFPEKRVYWVIGDQLLRSSTSIGANITEAKSSSSKREFIKYYEIALKSANETKYWLCLLKDSSLVEKASVEKILNEAIELSNMIGSSLLTMKGKR